MDPDLERGPRIPEIPEVSNARTSWMTSPLNDSPTSGSFALEAAGGDEAGVVPYIPPEDLGLSKASHSIAYSEPLLTNEDYFSISGKQNAELALTITIKMRNIPLNKFAKP